MQVIPDSIATLFQNLSRLRQEFISIGEKNISLLWKLIFIVYAIPFEIAVFAFSAEEQSTTGQAAGSQDRNEQNVDGTSHSSVQRGLPTPASLADVMLSARQLFNEQAAECLRVFSILRIFFFAIFCFMIL